MSVLYKHSHVPNKKSTVFSFYFLLNGIWWLSKIKSILIGFVPTAVV